MNEAYQDAIREAFAIAPAHEVIYDTLEIKQEGVQSSIFLVRATQPLTAFDENGNERLFVPMGFEFKLPPSDADGNQSLSITIDNVRRSVTDFIDVAKSEKAPVEIIYRPYLSSDLSAPQMNPPLRLFLKDIQDLDHQVSGRATFMDLVNKKFPSRFYTRSHFPTL